MSEIPAAFSPRTVDGGERFTIRVRRGWAPWALWGLAAGALLFGVSLYGVIGGASLTFSVVAVLLAGAGARMYRDEVTEVELRTADLVGAAAYEVLGEEQPVLRVVWPDRPWELFDASGHEADEVRALIAALRSR